MFVLGKIKTIKKRIEFSEPADYGAEPQKVDFIAEFKLRTQSELKARENDMAEYIKALKDAIEKFKQPPQPGEEKPADFNLPSSPEVDGYILEDLVGLEGVLDIDGNEIEFSEELAKGLLNYRPSRNALIPVWSAVNQLNSQEQALEKN